MFPLLLDLLWPAMDSLFKKCTQYNGKSPDVQGISPECRDTKTEFCLHLSNVARYHCGLFGHKVCLKQLWKVNKHTENDDDDEILEDPNVDISMAGHDPVSVRLADSTVSGTKTKSVEGEILSYSGCDHSGFFLLW